MVVVVVVVVVVFPEDCVSLFHSRLRQHMTTAN